MLALPLNRCGRQLRAETATSGLRHDVQLVHLTNEAREQPAAWIQPSEDETDGGVLALLGRTINNASGEVSRRGLGWRLVRLASRAGRCVARGR